MILIVILIQVAGFYILLCSSKKALLPQDKISLWLRHRAMYARPIGVLIILVSLLFFTLLKGIAAGLCVGVIVLMTVSSLMIVLVPKRKKK